MENVGREKGKELQNRKSRKPKWKYQKTERVAIGGEQDHLQVVGCFLFLTYALHWTLHVSVTAAVLLLL